MLTTFFSDPAHEETPNLESANEGKEKEHTVALRGHPDRARELSKLAFDLVKQYSKTEDLKDLEEAIRASRDGLSATPKDDPTRSQRLTNLCVYVGMKFNRTEASDDLEEAIIATSEAMASVPSKDPNRAALLSKLAVLLGVRYSRTNSRTDIEEAIRVQREALDMGARNHPKRIIWTANLAGYIGGRFEVTKARADIDECVEICRAVVDMAPIELPRRLLYLSNLANILEERYLRFGDMVDLDHAIKITKSFIASNSGHPARCGMMNNYGTLLDNRYLATGSIQDLEEALAMGKEAIELLPPGDPDRPRFLSNFAIQLSRRFEALGTMADLDRAVQLGKEAVEISSEGQLAKSLNNLGILLKNQYQVTGEMKDLDYAIRIQRQAVSANDDHPDAMSNLSGLLNNRFQRTETPTELVEAQQIARQVINICPKDHPNRPVYLNTLGVLLGASFAQHGSRTDLEEAVQIAQEAVVATGEDHPQRAARLTNLGDRLADRFATTKEMADFERAIACHQSALRHSPSAANARIVAGRAILKLCATVSDWQKAYETAELTIQLVPKLTSMVLENRDKQNTLSQVFGLASDAAAIAFKAGKGALAALRFLEQGRGILARSLEEKPPNVPAIKQRHLDLEDQFALAPSEADYLNAAIPGPIAVINVSEFCCHAVLVEKHQIQSLALSSLKIEHIRAKTQEEELDSPKVLEWLWDNVASPILDALGLMKPQGLPVDNDLHLPHIWWVPTGVLNTMPLHAAGHHYPGSTETVLDRAISSYSSSIRAIIYGRRRRSDLSIKSASSVQDKALLVAMERTPGNSKLLHAKEEILALRSLCKTIDFDPIEPGRRKQDIISHLSQCKIFHFAGHGYTNETNPSKSSLLLEDWQTDPLTLATLQEINLRDRAPFLAYLSACGTGQIRHEQFLDESLHLISGCQIAGFRHVIGTLWAVSDEHSVDMAKITYKEIRRGDLADKSVCQGLHKATRQLRDSWLKRQEGISKARRQTKNAEVERSLETEANELSRDVESDDDEDEDTNPLHWVPYVHYGV